MQLLGVMQHSAGPVSSLSLEFHGKQRYKHCNWCPSTYLHVTWILWVPETWNLNLYVGIPLNVLLSPHGLSMVQQFPRLPKICKSQHLYRMHPSGPDISSPRLLKKDETRPNSFDIMIAREFLHSIGAENDFFTIFKYSRAINKVVEWMQVKSCILS